MAQYRKTIFNLAGGPGEAIADPRAEELARQQQIALQAQELQQQDMARRMAAQQAAQAAALDRQRLMFDREKFGAGMQESALDRAMKERLFGQGHQNAMELAQLGEGGLDRRQAAGFGFQSEQGDLERAIRERLAVMQEGGANARASNRNTLDLDLATMREGGEDRRLGVREKGATERSKAGIEATSENARLDRGQRSLLARLEAEQRARQLEASEAGATRRHKERMKSEDRTYDLQREKLNMAKGQASLEQRTAANMAVQPIIESLQSGQATEVDVRKALETAQILDRSAPGALEALRWYLSQGPFAATQSRSYSPGMLARLFPNVAEVGQRVGNALGSGASATNKEMLSYLLSATGRQAPRNNSETEGAIQGGPLNQGTLDALAEAILRADGAR